MPVLDNIIRDGLRALQRHLPPGWKAERASAPRDTAGAGACIRVTAPDRRAARLKVEARRHLEPRGVLQLRTRLREIPGDSLSLVVAPYLGSAVRERLREAGLMYLDLTGNTWIALSKPGLVIETQGADVNPERKARPSRSLRGAKAGRIVRALLDGKQPPGVRALAEQANVDPGYVSRVVSLLEREALVERGPRGKLIKVDRPRLLRRWAEDAPLASRGRQATCLDPRGLIALQARLKSLKMRYAITGSLAATSVASLAPPRLAMIYVEELDRAMSALNLRAIDSGANVLLMEPDDAGVFDRTMTRNGLVYVATSQAAADLLTSPGRGPAEAEELIAWLSKHEEAWRG